jgi:hypothetical protein
MVVSCFENLAFGAISIYLFSRTVSHNARNAIRPKNPAASMSGIEISGIGHPLFIRATKRTTHPMEIARNKMPPIANMSRLHGGFPLFTGSLEEA